MTLLTIYLTGLALALVYTNAMMAWGVAKHNITIESEHVAKEWFLALIWPATLAAAAWLYLLEGLRWALHGSDE